MILVVGYGAEGTIRHLTQQLTRSGLAFHLLDLATLLTCGSFTLDHTSTDIAVAIDSNRFLFGEYDAFFSRAYYTDLGSPPRNEALSTLLTEIAGFLESTQRPVINRPSAGAGNSNKFWHTVHLAQHGFAVPETVLLGSPAIAREMLAPGRAWVSKSCSSARTVAALLDVQLIERIDTLATCPSLFQRFVDGHNVRVHVVGGYYFAERIKSDAVDYRYLKEGQTNEYGECLIPYAVENLCFSYCRRERLLFAGFDFMVSAEGEWIVLEANPMPGYENYDRRCDGRISNAIWSLLTPPLRPFIAAARRPLLKPPITG